MAKSYYAILGVRSNASHADVKAAYRRLAKAFHPDQYDGTDQPFLEVQEAYSVLSDAGRRREYDNARARKRCTPEPVYDRAVSPSFRRMRWESTGRPEPLVPGTGRRTGRSPVWSMREDLRENSPLRSFQTFASSLDEIFDWLWNCG